MIVKASNICSTCDRTHTIDKKSLSEGREYYSCSECRMWDRKSRGYVPFDFLSTLKRKLKNMFLCQKDKINQTLSCG